MEGFWQCRNFLMHGVIFCGISMNEFEQKFENMGINNNNKKYKCGINR